MLPQKDRGPSTRAALAQDDGMDPRPLIYGLAMGQECTRHSKRGGSAMEITTIGIDLAKSVFAVSGADRRGKVVLRRQLRRAQVLEFMSKLGPCVVGIE